MSQELSYTYPSSAKLLAPVQASNPDAIHTARLAPTLCVFATIIPGEELRDIVSLRGSTEQKLSVQYSGANLVR